MPALDDSALQPGFMVIHGNRLEALRGLAVEWMRRHPLGPLENETILVQSNGISQWLKLALAADESRGGAGIAAALDVTLPARFLWQAYRSVLGEEQVPPVSPFDKPRLVWRLMRLLPALLDAPCSPPWHASWKATTTCASATSWPSAWPTSSTSTRSTAPTGSPPGPRARMC